MNAEVFAPLGIMTALEASEGAVLQKRQAHHVES